MAFIIYQGHLGPLKARLCEEVAFFFSVPGSLELEFLELVELVGSTDFWEEIICVVHKKFRLVLAKQEVREMRCGILCLKENALNEKGNRGLDLCRAPLASVFLENQQENRTPFGANWADVCPKKLVLHQLGRGVELSLRAAQCKQMPAGKGVGEGVKTSWAEAWARASRSTGCMHCLNP